MLCARIEFVHILEGPAEPLAQQPPPRQSKTHASDLETRLLAMAPRSDLEGVRKSLRESEEAWEARYAELERKSRAELEELGRRLAAAQETGRGSEDSLAQAMAQIEGLRERLRAAEERETQGLEREAELARARAEAVREAEGEGERRTQKAREDGQAALAKAREDLAKAKALHAAALAASEQAREEEARLAREAAVHAKRAHADEISALKAAHSQELEGRRTALEEMGVQVSRAEGLKGENEALSAWLLNKEEDLKVGTLCPEPLPLRA